MTLEVTIRNNMIDSDCGYIYRTCAMHELGKEHNRWVGGDVTLYTDDSGAIRDVSELDNVKGKPYVLSAATLWRRLYYAYMRKILKAYRVRVAHKPGDEDYIYGFCIHDKGKVVYTHIKHHYRPVESIRTELEEGLNND